MLFGYCFLRRELSNSLSRRSTVFSFENPVDTSLASYSVVKEPTLAGRGRPDCQTPPPMSSEIGRFHPLRTRPFSSDFGLLAHTRFPRAEELRIGRRQPACASSRQPVITTYHPGLFHRFAFAFSARFYVLLSASRLANLARLSLRRPSKIARLFHRDAGVLTTPAPLVISDVVRICCWFERRRELRTPHPHSPRRLAG